MKKKIYIAYEDWYPFKAGYAFDWWDEEKQEYSILASHLSTDEWFVMLDMWYIMNDGNYIGKQKHKIYEEEYPDWYELVWFWPILSFSDEERLRDLLTKE